MFWKHKSIGNQASDWSTNQRPGFQLTYASKTLAHDPALRLKLPNGIKSNEIGWLSVWRVKYAVNFGDLPFFMSDDTPSKKWMDQKKIWNFFLFISFYVYQFGFLMYFLLIFKAF